MRNDRNQQLMMEELEDAVTQPQKFALLQKYGIIEPKLTKAELRLIQNEQGGGNYGRKRN